MFRRTLVFSLAVVCIVGLSLTAWGEQQRLGICGAVEVSPAPSFSFEAQEERGRDAWEISADGVLWKLKNSVCCPSGAAYNFQVTIDGNTRVATTYGCDAAGYSDFADGHAGNVDLYYDISSGCDPNYVSNYQSSLEAGNCYQYRLGLKDSELTIFKGKVDCPDGGGSSADIGPEGGSVSAAGATVTIPAGSVSSTGSFSLTEKGSLGGYPDNVVGNSYEFTYNAPSIKGDLEVEINLPSGYSGQDIKLGVSQSGDSWFNTEGESMINFLDASGGDGKITASLHFDYDAAAASSDGHVEIMAASSGAITLQPTKDWDNAEFQPFVLKYPAKEWPVAENRHMLLLQAANTAYKKLKALGFTQVENIGKPAKDNSEFRWFPINVSKTMGAESWGLCMLTKGGEDDMYIDLNNTYCDPANLDAMRIVLGHEIFHAVQELLDPRWTLETLTHQKRLLWLKEASSVWFEYEMSSDPANYVPKSHDGWDEYSGKGLEWGVHESGVSNKEVQNVGYWASNFLRWLSENKDKSVVLNVWTRVGESTDYIGLLALVDALGGETPANSAFTEFSEAWLFGKTGFKWGTPASIDTWSPGDGATKSFSGDSWSYSCRKYALYFNQDAAGKEYTISIEKGLGVAGVEFKLWQAQTVKAQPTFVQQLTGPFTFKSTGSEIYYVTLVNTDYKPFGTSVTPFEIKVSEKGGSSPGCDCSFVTGGTKKDDSYNASWRGESDYFAVDTFGDSCSLSAKADVGWINITKVQKIDNRHYSIGWSVGANNGAYRTGKIAIEPGGCTYTINQPGT